MIPLILKLKKSAHKEIAKAQDLIVEVLYKTFSGAVMHGGTSIWRCYHGNRFSEDIDVYIPYDTDKLNALFKCFEKAGFLIVKRKTTENALYSNLKYDNTFVRFEALFKQVKGSLAEYETSSGALITIYSLTPEELVNEKAQTYLKRRKIRDLYDVFFLLRFVKDRTSVTKVLKELITSFQEPVDEKELEVLILEGIVPKKADMLSYIKRWC